MKLRTCVWCVVTATLFASCGGGGGAFAPLASSTPTPTQIAVPLQEADGMLTIDEPVVGPSSSSRARSPAFVSSLTKHAALFIDGATAAAGTSTCSTTGTSGTGTACTIPWKANLSVPASHYFAVEIDGGPSDTPANTVAAEGRAQYALVAGSANNLGTMTLNGTVATVSYSVTGCTAGTCNGNISLSTPASVVITYTGGATVPNTSNAPTTGTVYDNGNVTFVSSNTGSGGGLVTGIAQSSGANVFSTYAANTLTVSGVSTTGIYTYQVACNATGTGTFGITAALAGSPSLDVSAAELAALSPAVSYPSGITVLTTAPSFSCTNGAIGDAFGTIPVN